MIPLLPTAEPDRPRRILCLGAHCDDIEIGCGGTLAHWIAGGTAIEIALVVLSSNEVRAAETRKALGQLLAGAAALRIEVRDFRNGYFPWAGAEIKDYVETLKAWPAPDLILAPWREDRHQDHRAVSDLVWNTFRDHLILEYEIPKWDGDLGQPNVYVPLSAAAARLKVDTLLTCFPSQNDKHWFTADTFNGLMRLRGVECAAASGWAEAFHGRKLVLG